jgi:hypothetical protein
MLAVSVPASVSTVVGTATQFLVATSQHIQSMPRATAPATWKWLIGTRYGIVREAADRRAEVERKSYARVTRTEEGMGGTPASRTVTRVAPAKVPAGRARVSCPLLARRVAPRAPTTLEIETVVFAIAALAAPTRPRRSIVRTR